MKRIGNSGNRIIINFFSSGLQAIAGQILGVFFFYIVSLYLSKESFGLLSWSNAIAILLTTLLSFGLEQVVLRRVAASGSSDWAAAAYLLHALVGSVITIFVLWLISRLSQGGHAMHVLQLIFVAQTLLYVASPLRLLLNAKENFTPYGIIAITSNVLKIVVSLIFIRSGNFMIEYVIYILTGSALFELGALMLYVYSHGGLKFNFRLKAYYKLIREALPQYLAVIFDTSLSRMDWILLGFLSTKVVTAEYSFAYRAFEVAKLPLLIIGPLILPPLARLFFSGSRLLDSKKEQIRHLLSMEIFCALAIVITINFLWSPVVDFITGGKYGSSNALIFFLLSLCLPLQFAINLFWTLCFADKKYLLVTRITIIAAVTNLILDLLFIPFYGAPGAAIAYILSSLVQAGLYYIAVQRSILTISLRPLIFLFLIALFCFGTAYYFILNPLIACLAAVTAYAGVSVLLRQVRREHFETLRLYFKK